LPRIVLFSGNRIDPVVLCEVEVIEGDSLGLVIRQPTVVRRRVDREVT